MAILHKENNFTIIDYKASAILYNFLVAKKIQGHFILPVNICPVVESVFIAAGITVDFADICPYNLCIDEQQLFDLLSRKKYTGVLLNHTYGVEVSFEELVKKLKSKYDIVVIEDKCLCLPDLKANNAVDLTLFSTGYSKFIELKYGGGIGITNAPFNKDALTGQIVKLSNNIEIVLNKFNVSFHDYISDIENLKEKTLTHKSEINEIYKNLLTAESLKSDFNNWRFNILVENKKQIIDKIFKEGLFASSHYSPLINDPSKFPNAVYLYEHVINLFNDFYFNKDMALKITSIINSLIMRNDTM